MTKKIKRPTMALGLLLLSSFTMVSTEFVVVGLLPFIARDFQVEIGKTGLLVTLFAVTTAIASPVLTIVTGSIHRKKILLLSLLCLLLGNLLAAWAPTLEILALARWISAGALALFWPVGIVMATQLVPAHAQGRALAVILAGVALASAVGLPVGTLIGQTFTWRTTFGVFAWLSAGILVAAWALLPETPLIRAPGILQQFHLLRKREVISSFGITVTVATGHYMVFTFISPFLEKVYTLHASTSSMFLLVLGVGSIAGNFLGGKAVDKNLPLTLLITLAGLLVVLGLLSISSMHFAWLTILILTWGATSAAVNVGLQYWLVKLVPEAPETVSALNVSFINAGIGLGSALGAFVVQNQGLEKINNYGALLILLALLLFLGTLYIRIRQTNLRKAATCNAVLMVSFFLIVG